jgi:hypothetical protein
MEADDPVNTIDMSEFLNLISDPGTGKIFHIPVITSKGIVREQNEIIETHDPKDTFYIVVALKSFITSFLDKYPQYKKQQYHSDIIKTSHISNRNKISQFIKNNKYDELKSYDNYSISLFSNNEIHKIMGYAPDNIIYHIIDNCIDINCEHDSDDGWALINFICHHCCANSKHHFIKYIINNGGDMSHKCKDGYYPIHQIIRYSYNNDDIKRFGLEKHVQAGLSLFLCNGNGTSVLDMIVERTNSLELINYTLSLIDTNSVQFKQNINGMINVISHNPNITSSTRDKVVYMLEVYKKQEKKN